MPLDPITLYKDGISRRIPAIDAPGWIGKGWLKEPLNEVGSDRFLLPDSFAPPPTSPPAISVVIEETQTNKRGK